MRERINDSDLKVKVGLTNGEVKEKMNRRLQRGLTNGDGKGGFTNGAGKKEDGFINGAGKGNEVGFTNGMGEGDVIKHNDPEFYGNRKSKKNKKTKLQVISMGVLVLLIMSLFVYGTNILIDDTTTIDGNFDEWENTIDLNFANMDVVKDGNNKMLIHLNKQDMFKGNGEKTDSYLIFINDKTVNEGFLLGYETYEYYIEIYGTNNTMEKVIGYQFDENREQYDWNGFNSRYSSFSLKRAWDKDNVEIEIRSVHLGRTNLSEISLLVYHFYPTTDFEYSQVVDIDKEATYGEFHIGTRTNNDLYFNQDLENKTLEINTINPMAYSYIPYEVRIVKEYVQSIQLSTESNIINTSNTTSISNTTNVSNVSKLLIEKNMCINLTIIYENEEFDIINQCGGIIIETTISFVTLNDTGFFIRHINNSVDKCIFDGYFGYKEVYKSYGTRSIISFENTPYINDDSHPSPRQTVGTNTELECRPTSYPNITIDGSISYATHNEWYPSEYFFVNVVSNDVDIGVMKDEEYLYVYMDNYQQNQDETGDFAEIYFDLWNAENTSPNNNTYKKYRITANNVKTYWEGSGSGWATQTIPSGWSSANSYIGGTTDRQFYEFKIPLSNLSISGSWNEHSESIGFGAYAVDVQQTDQHTWYPSQYQQANTPTTQYADKPDEWADIVYTNYTMFAKGTTNIVTMDGVLNESLWLNDADMHLVDETQDMRIYTVMNETYLYVGVEMLGDTTLSSGDFCQVFLDRANFGELYPQVSDCGFSISGGNSTNLYHGSGSGWGTGEFPPDAKAYASYTNGNVSFEFQMPLINITIYDTFKNDSDEMGFMVLGNDVDGGYYIQYPDGYGIHDMRYDPQCWGDIQIVVIPEGNILIMSGIMFGITFFVMIEKRKIKNKEGVV